VPGLLVGVAMPVVTTIHALVKDPEREYVALARRAHGDG
jgi:hypothetical protein